MDGTVLFSFCILMSLNVLLNAQTSDPQDILRRIEELERRERLQRTEMGVLRQQNTAMADEINQLKARDVEQSRKIATLEEREMEMALEMDHLIKTLGTDMGNDRTDTVGKETGNDQTDTDTGPHNDTTLSDEEEHIKGIHVRVGSGAHTNGKKTGRGVISPIRNRARQTPDQASTAFFSTITYDLLHLGQNQPIVFDNVITNIGQAYSEHSGVFTAPASGVYVISTTIIGYGQPAHYQISLNANLVSKLFADPRTEQFQTTSQTVVFSLNRGDEVTVRNVDTDRWLQVVNRILKRQAFQYTEITVAFFATLTNHMSHLGANQAITFDNVTTNAGTAYNPHSGFFTAPVTGIYVFSATILGYHTKADYEFTVNGVMVSRMWVYAESSTNIYQTTSQTAVLHLNQGDDVSIRNMGADQMAHGLHYSSFCGFLLSQNDASSQIVG